MRLCKPSEGSKAFVTETPRKPWTSDPDRVPPGSGDAGPTVHESSRRYRRDGQRRRPRPPSLR